MALVKVWNDNSYPHTEKFKGTKITIEPGAFIELDYEEAIEFLGGFTPRVKRGDGTDDPRFFKKLRMEKPKTPVVAELPLVNHANGAVATTPEALAGMVAQFAHLRAVDPVAEAEAKANQTSMAALAEQNKQLMARLSALEAQGAPPKRGPGLPRKEANA